jgi:hypothetical protein
VRQIKIYKYTNRILGNLLCIFVNSPTKPLFGQNKYTYAGAYSLPIRFFLVVFFLADLSYVDLVLVDDVLDIQR